MKALDIIHATTLQKKVPDLKPGLTVRVYQRIREGEKERTQMFEGLIIAVGSGTGVHKTFTVRKVVDGVGVEKVYPIYGSTIEKIVLRKKAQVRRAKLYYLRDAVGKAGRLKETMIKEEATVVPEKASAKVSEPEPEEVVEAPVEEEKAE